jgi:hypothetical protein
MAQALDIISQEQGKRITDAIRQEFLSFVSIEGELREERNREAREAARLALILVLVGSISVGIVLALFSRKQLALVSESYGKALDREREQNAVLQDQAWLKSAQTEIGTLIRGERTLTDLSDGAVQFICRYVDAKAGALYLADGSRRLELQGSYALAREDRERVRYLAFGESLAGQAASEARVLMLDPAPAGHLKIGSALGHSEPASVVCAPITADGNVTGVIELAFNRPLSPRDRELLEVLSESSGVSVKAGRPGRRPAAHLDDRRPGGRGGPASSHHASRHRLIHRQSAGFVAAGAAPVPSRAR